MSFLLRLSAIIFITIHADLSTFNEEKEEE
jgi:hypothetical protein